MQKPAVAFAILSLCACVLSVPVLAQGASTITSPPGHLTTAGSRTSLYLGRYADGRFQMADGELRGRVMTMSRIDFRLDNRNYTTTTGSGRSWTRVTLDMSETSVAEMSLSWDQNNLTTPTRVFDSRMTWPTVSGRPSSTPWGHVAFPFSKAWVYTGKNDMLADYQFSGGTLANAVRWAGSSNAYYYLDGIPNEDFLSGDGVWMPAANNNCNDSAITITRAAYTYGYATAFHEWYTTYTYRDKLRLRWYSYYTAPAKTVVHALGIGGGDVQGFDLGAQCHRLHLDTTKPFLLVTKTTENTATAYSGDTQILVPFLGVWKGIKFHVQGAWTDSSTGLFALTQARSFEVPGYPTGILKKRLLMHYNPASGTGLGPYTAYTALTLPRITYQ